MTVPDFVEIETPRGNSRVARVLDWEWDASVSSLERVLTVDCGRNRTLRVPESQAAPA